MLCNYGIILVCLCLNDVGGATLWEWTYENQHRDIHDVLRDSFDITHRHAGIGIGANDSLSIAPDPELPHHYVLKVFYKKGTWTHYNSQGQPCATGEKCQRGASLYIRPNALTGHGHSTLTLEYEVLFDEHFQWNKGGKLPGLYGGTLHCSGGHISDTCFSTRLMWLSEGAGIVYAYVTHDQHPSWDAWCQNFEHVDAYRKIHCTPTTGIDIGKGSFQFRKNHWHKIRQTVRLNTKSGEYGSISLWIDDHAEIHVSNIVMRNNLDFNIDGIMFSTFYGGGDKSWACPKDANAYFRNFRLSTDAHTPVSSQLVG